MSGKLIMTKGLPGSGKSTWAKDQAGAVIVCKDDIRHEMNHKTWNYDVEKEVLRVRDFRIGQGLSKGKVVISADTNLVAKHEARLRDLARKYKAEFEVKSFLDIPLAECIRRDKLREEYERVGEKVIVKMAEDHLDPSDLIVRTAEPGRPQLFVDLDGVLADFDGFIEKELGIENNRENELPDFWDRARAYPGRLYFDMGPMPDAARLWAALRPFRPIILTGCPWSIPTAADDKREWVAKWIDPEAQVVCCKSRNKVLYAKPGDILVDDWNKYKERWVARGGVWVTHVNVDNTIDNVVAIMEGRY